MQGEDSNGIGDGGFQLSSLVPMGTEYLFDRDDWISIQCDLVCIEAQLRSMADAQGGRVLGDVRGGLPARRLRQSRGWRVRELRVLLDPLYFEDGIVRYKVLMATWAGGLGLPFFRASSRPVETLTRLEVSDQARVEEVLSPLLG